MKVTLQLGWDKFIGDLSGAEVEVFNRIAGKLEQIEERYLDSQAEASPGVPHSRAGTYVFVTPENPKEPKLEIRVVDGKGEFVKRETFDAMVERVKAAEEAAKAAKAELANTEHQ